MKCITLVTDFSEKDGYPGIMKGVILDITPQAVIIDISHDIPPQDIRQAAILLARSAPYFPTGTIHVCVVDPDVGTERHGIIAQLGSQFFIGPDNGLMTQLFKRAVRDGLEIKIQTLQNPEYQLSPVSHTFHGRDIFAPAAGHLANGAPLSSFGESVTDPALLDFPVPTRTDRGWKGDVVSVDAFGNLACNLESEHIAHPESAEIRIKERMIKGLNQTFAEGQPGELIALLDSFGQLSICVVNGSAEKILCAHVGEPVWLIEN
ncbi:MAG: SAM-dependent chlorinase/fluorinase [Chloroflexi bacterium]|nr:SAM-dependent chlorinase/fluorinase [Chloroflexota bacterium]